MTIDVQPTSFRYIVEGMACGTVSVHQSLEEALESLRTHTIQYRNTHHDDPDFEIYDTVRRCFIDVKWNV